MRRQVCIASLLIAAIAMAVPGQVALRGADTNKSAVQSDSKSSTRDQAARLLQAKCVRCHVGPSPKAGLDLSTFAGALKGSESGPVIVPGKPDDSLLVQKIRAGKMPPIKNERLTDAEVRIVEQWVSTAANSESTAPAAITQHDVIPIMLRHCTVCHGLRRQEAKLDLHDKASMLRGGKSGSAIVPGKPEQSLLIKKLRAGLMPPNSRLVEASVKPVEPSEIETLVRWIAAGAPEVAIAPDVATTSPDPMVTDKDRQFWAFQPPKPVAIPTVHHQDRVRNPIDAFVLQKLEQRGLSLSPEADRVTLIRRVSFDLTGLPPEPAQIQEFLNDRAPGAYERLVDRLLASPRYGERWGRFWLDLAGYADSEGKREQDLPRPNAWRYRDYVIRSFNNDKPYDRFLLEQIAGDELADYEHTREITQEICDNLVATGFLRMAPDATWANITGYAPDRVEVIADEIDILGSAVMGMTMKCCRCHNHKFDPIPQRDYYRLVDIFKGAYDEYDWLKPDVRPGLGPVSQDPLGGRLLSCVTTTERRAWEANNARIESEISATNRLIENKVRSIQAKLPSFLHVDRNSLKAVSPTFKKDSDAADARIRSLQGQRAPEPKIQALWDRGEPSPTYIYVRGDSQHPGKLVGPGVPSVLTDGKTPFVVTPPWPGAKKTGRRLAFAKWLVQPNHPLTARVAVNQIWRHHFGVGLVKTPGNFGRAGMPPSHPELLDWLAREFVARGWSFKEMHRLMVTSATYRQSSAVSQDREKADPDNSLLSRMPLVRLDAEELYDSISLVAGRLDETQYGPADAIRARPDGLVTPTGSARGWRRLVYVQETRKQLATHLESFDFPAMNPNCIERRDSTVAPQALHLMNNGMVHQLAEQFAQRMLREAGPNPDKLIERVYSVAFGRPPSYEERKVALDGLAQLTYLWTNEPVGGKPAQPDASLKALTTFCHAILNSAGFLYVD
jgi:mono/diheme cytochrome c family protein